MRRRLQTRSQAGIFILITLAACSDRQDPQVCAVPEEAGLAALQADLAGCPSPAEPLLPLAAKVIASLTAYSRMKSQGRRLIMVS